MTDRTTERLTKDDLLTLRAPFAPDEHEFLNGNAYITEQAITTRLEDVDPNWTFDIISIINRNNIVYCVTRLTLKGVQRDGVGMSAIAYSSKDATRETNEAEKSAATNALKRAARLFGIGRYLLSLPSNVIDSRTLGNYLNGGTEKAPSQAQKPQYTHGQAMSVTLSGLTIRARQDDPNEDLLIFEVRGQEFKALAFNRDLFLQRGWITENDWLEHGDYTIAQLIPAVITYLAGERAYWAISDIDAKKMVSGKKAKTS